MRKLYFIAMSLVVVMMVVGTVLAQREGQPPSEDEARPRPQRAEGQAPGRQGRGAQGGDAQGRDAQGRGAGRAQGRGGRGGRGAQGGDAQGRDGQGEGRGAQGGQRMPRLPILIALDADKNGEISAEEIANAPAALKKIDANGDGKLTMEEMMPAGGQGRGGQGRPGGEGGAPGRGGQGRAGGEGERGNTNDMVARIMANDKNGDGKVDKEELPERMQRILERADTNKDGALDKGELEQMVERFRAGGGNREGGERPQRPGGNREQPNRPRPDNN